MLGLFSNFPSLNFAEAFILSKRFPSGVPPKELKQAVCVNTKIRVIDRKIPMLIRVL
jgi:hypothetical protein